VSSSKNGNRPGLSARVVRTKQAVLVARVDPGELARRVAPEFAEAVERIGAHGLIAVPLVARGQTLGALTIVRYRPSSPAFAEDDLTLLRDNTA
jgi:transcriptional regulator with GAF, ATPase, and Fis domain